MQTRLDTEREEQARKASDDAMVEALMKHSPELDRETAEEVVAELREALASETALDLADGIRRRLAGRPEARASSARKTELIEDILRRRGLFGPVEPELPDPIPDPPGERSWHGEPPSPIRPAALPAVEPVPDMVVEPAVEPVPLPCVCFGDLVVFPGIEGM